MPIVAPQFIEELCAQSDIVAVIGEVVKLRKRGRNHLGLCPFHSEKTPSFTVFEDKNFYKCFGCGESGDVIKFVRERYGLDFQQAVENLAARMGKPIVYEQGSVDGSVNRLARQRKEAMLELLAQVSSFYQEQLKRHSRSLEVREYLRARGLGQSCIDEFAMGYAPPGGDNLAQGLRASDDARKLLLELGLLGERQGSQGEYFDVLRHRLVLPIRDRSGKTLGFGARVLDPEDKPKYLNSPESPVFEKHRVLYGLCERRARRLGQQDDAKNVLVITEGYLDAAGLAAHGFPGAAAALGTALSVEQLDLAFKEAASVALCFDGDAAGQKAAARTLPAALQAMRDGREIRYLLMPAGDDPDSLVQREGLPAFKSCLDQAAPLSKFFFDVLGADIDAKSSLEQRISLKENALELLAPFADSNDSMFFSGLFEELSRRCGVPVDDLLAYFSRPDVKRFFAERSHQSRAHDKRKEGPLSASSCCRELIIILSKRPDLAVKRGDPSDWLEPDWSSVDTEHDKDLREDVQLLCEVLRQLRVGKNFSSVLESYAEYPPEWELLHHLARRGDEYELQLRRVSKGAGLEGRFDERIKYLEERLQGIPLRSEDQSASDGSEARMEFERKLLESQNKRKDTDMPPIGNIHRNFKKAARGYGQSS